MFNVRFRDNTSLYYFLSDFFPKQKNSLYTNEGCGQNDFHVNLFVPENNSKIQNI